MDPMRLLLATVSLIAFLANSTVCRSEETPVANQNDVHTLVQGNNAFALDLYARLQTQDGNLFFSPSSLSSALGMTYSGAAGQTADEMAKVLHFTLGEERLNAAVAKLVEQFNGKNTKRPYQLNVANALWAQKGYEFLAQFTSTIADYYGGTFHAVDFKNGAEQARQTINAWVEKQTQDKIRELLQPGVLDADTRLVLTNAIYFKGNWVTPFGEKRTREGEFLAVDKKVLVPFMHQTEHFGYLDETDFQALKLPYEGGLSLIALLPKKPDGLPQLEESLTAAKLEKYLARLRTHDVDVTFPKFKVTSQFQLNQVLAQMGMSLAFSDRADFSRMTKSESLKVSAVVHKAYVDVNEKGTEAAAATAVVVEIASARNTPKRVSFKADHPFLFLIRDDRSGSILFLGRVMNPTS
jgi:serpin B